MGVAVEVVAGWQIGTEVVCPRCGAVGRTGIDTFRARGKKYEYLTIRHYEGNRIRRCIIGPASAAQIPVTGTEGHTQVPETRSAAKVPEVEAQVSEAGTSAQVRKVSVIQIPEVKAPGTAVQIPAGAGTEEVVAEVPEPPKFTDVAPIPAEVDRVAWYIVKVSASWGSFRENPSEGNFSRFVRTVDQVSQRLGVPSGDVVAAAEYYFRVRSERAKTVVNEAVKRFIARMVVANTAYFASAAGTETAVGTSTSVPEEIAVAVKEVSEAVRRVEEEVAAVRREVEYIKEQVRQRKGPGARAVARGEKKVEIREGSMYWMIREVMRSGGEWTKEQIVEEIFRRFGKRVSGNSVSGRMSEMAAAGYVTCRRVGRTWVWRWVGP